MRSTANTSGALAAGTTTLFTGKGTLNSIQLVADGTNAATVTVYDNTAGSGKAIAALSIAATGTHQGIAFEAALRHELGLTVVVTGTGAAAYIGYGG